MSPEVESKMKSIFPPEGWPEVAAILETECGANLPLIDSQGAEGIERAAQGQRLERRLGGSGSTHQILLRTPRRTR